MKRLALAVASSAVIFSLLSSITFAQSATSSSTRKEQMASREAALKAKLQVFQDKKKAEATQRIDTNLNKVNQKRTANAMQQLDKMSDILNRLDSTVSKASADGKDTTQALAAITSAKSAIDSAKKAVYNQSQKQYNLTVTSESKIKADAQTARDGLKTDLKSIHSLVVAARQVVANAISTTKSTLGGKKSGK